MLIEPVNGKYELLLSALPYGFDPAIDRVSGALNVEDVQPEGSGPNFWQLLRAHIVVVSFSSRWTSA